MELSHSLVFPDKFETKHLLFSLYVFALSVTQSLPQLSFSLWLSLSPLRFLWLLSIKEILPVLVNIKLSKPAIPPFLSVWPDLYLFCLVSFFHPCFLRLISSCLFQQHMRGL